MKGYLVGLVAEETDRIDHKRVKKSALLAMSLSCWNNGAIFSRLWVHFSQWAECFAVLVWARLYD